MKFKSSKSVNINSLDFRYDNSQQESNTLKSTPEKQQHDLKSNRILSIISGRDACIEGLNGSFVPVENDFTLKCNYATEDGGQHFSNDPRWSEDRKERVKRFRFVVCTLGLSALALGIMSRIILNVSIVDMVKGTDPNEIDGMNRSSTNGPLINSLEQESTTVAFLDSSTHILTQTTNSSSTSFEPLDAFEIQAPEEMIRFEWSGVAQNVLLGSFHIGYIPSMLMSGGIADKYGAKYPLFVCIFGSVIVNSLTPILAHYGIHFLIGLRVFLGIIHGSMVPSVYDLFNKWLTLSETSIFVPLIKVSMSAGILLASALPGFMASLGFDWPYTFYTASFLCLIWSILWLLLATSTPQTNRFVESNELHRIMRKKKQPVVVQMKLAEVSTINVQTSSTVKFKSPPITKQQDKTVKESIPWLKIITNQSVIALTIVKYTYNLGMEIWSVELAVYLRKVHDASTTTISAIASGCSILQMALLTLIGWLAQRAVDRKLFGFSRTSWRKIFQGMSNFSIAIIYVIFTFVGHDLFYAGLLITLIHFFWMFGAGGESMVPYDLSSRYPATIMGVSHGISVLSGLTIPSVCGLVLGDYASDSERWNILFLLMAGALTFGGLVFSLVLKAEPFLAGEKVSKTVRK